MVGGRECSLRTSRGPAACACTLQPSANPASTLPAKPHPLVAVPQVLVLLDTQRSGYVDLALLLMCLLALW